MSAGTVGGMVPQETKVLPMSVKMALAKLSATAAGTALLVGGAAHVAETQAANPRQIKSVKSVKAKPVNYVKHRTVAKRHIPKTVKRKRTIVRREVECVPAGPAAIGQYGATSGMAHGPVTGTVDANCPPTFAYAMAPIMLP
ncbi:MAG: hypothetical protein ACK4NZ_04850, partial [Tsuneonella sp.]